MTHLTPRRCRRTQRPRALPATATAGTNRRRPLAVTARQYHRVARLSGRFHWHSSAARGDAAARETVQPGARRQRATWWSSSRPGPPDESTRSWPTPEAPAWSARIPDADDEPATIAPTHSERRPTAVRAYGTANRSRPACHHCRWGGHINGRAGSVASTTPHCRSARPVRGSRLQAAQGCGDRPGKPTGVTTCALKPAAPMRSDTLSPRAFACARAAGPAA